MGALAAPTPKARTNPVAGLPRTGSAANPKLTSSGVPDPYHAFPDIIDNFAIDAQAFDIPTIGPGGTIVRQSKLYQLEGSLGGKKGVFEWIVDNGCVTHRRFVPGGRITGTPNQVPPGK
jgi:filamentous hemagglutinin